MTITDTMPTEVATFNLHAAARSVIDEGASVDPHVLAKDLVARVPADETTRVFERMAAVYLRGVMGNVRVTERSAVARELTHSQPAGGSKKMAAARDAWQRLLDSPEYVTSAGWLRLREATCEQVLEMSELRAIKASENIAASHRYAALAAAMKTHDAATVADLPKDVFVGVMTKGAAS